jgi:hypothetical protein
LEQSLDKVRAIVESEYRTELFAASFSTFAVLYVLINTLALVAVRFSLSLLMTVLVFYPLILSWATFLSVSSLRSHLLRSEVETYSYYLHRIDKLSRRFMMATITAWALISSILFAGVVVNARENLNQTASYSLTIDDQDVVSMLLQVRIPRSDMWTGYFIILPFTTTGIAGCFPRQIICMSSSLRSGESVLYVITNPGTDSFEVSSTAVGLSQESKSGQGIRRIEINFTPDQSDEFVAWVVRQPNLIGSFRTVNVTFSPIVPLDSIDDSPHPVDTPWFTRVYNYSDIVRNGGHLVINYQAGRASTLYLISGVLASFTTIFDVVLDDKLRKHHGILSGACVVFVVLSIATGYFYLRGPLFVNEYLSLLLPIVAHETALVYIRFRRERS